MEPGKPLPTPPNRLHPIRHGCWSFYYRRGRKLEGYRFVIFCCAVTGVLVILVNLAFTIWATTTFGVHDGFGTLQKGDCGKTKTLNFWIHLAINILSTLLLGASNYSMQCLSSPTRQEIDKAHARRAWLDVGVPSFRNLRRLSKRRIILWWLLALSSIPLHLLYNSTVFSTFSTQEYSQFLVTSDFAKGAPFDLSLSVRFDMPLFYPSNVTYYAYKSSELGADGVRKGSALLQKYQQNLASLTRLENEACVKAYTSAFVSAHSDVLLLSTYPNSSNSLLSVIMYTDSPVVSGGDPDNMWLCLLPPGRGTPPCRIRSGQPPFGDSNPDVSIQYCLSQPVEEQCKTQFSLDIIITVLLCNLVKVFCMGTIVWKQDSEPLVTLGDAVSTFLRTPDLTTRDIPLYGKSRFKSTNMWDLACSRLELASERWFRSVSKRRWITCNIL